MAANQREGRESYFSDSYAFAKFAAVFSGLLLSAEICGEASVAER
jgi:hypothetical protein